MIPPEFGYLRCRSVNEALEALSRYGDDAKILAGGHSLVPVLKMRLNEPSLLIDLGRVEELKVIEDHGDELVIGAMTTYQQVVDSPLVRKFAPVLRQGVGTIGDPQVRHRGTLGGSLAHADPAGDAGPLVVALGGDLLIAGPEGLRRVSADSFFVDYFETVLADDEILIGIAIPKREDLRGWYEKFNRAAHMWSVVGSCAVVGEAAGKITHVRVVLTNMASTPVRATATEVALAGGNRDDVIRAAALASEGTSPTSDANAGADYRRHLARVLTERALFRALGEDGDDRGARS